jgi:hypothetical protein
MLGAGATDPAAQTAAPGAEESSESQTPLDIPVPENVDLPIPEFPEG